MANTLTFVDTAAPARRASDRRASAETTEFPILDRDGDVVRFDRRIPDEPRNNIDVEWLPVAMEVNL